MKIYSCSAGEQWEGASETFVTTNEEKAKAFCQEIITNNNPHSHYKRDWASLEIWENEKKIEEIDYDNEHPYGYVWDYEDRMIPL